MVIWTYKDTDQVTEEQGTNLTITCSALGGRPPVQINWFLNGEHLQPIWVTVTNSSINGTYDTESQVCVDLSYANGTISCESNPQLTTSSQIVEIMYVTYGKQNLSCVVLDVFACAFHCTFFYFS